MIASQDIHYKCAMLLLGTKQCRISACFLLLLFCFSLYIFLCPFCLPLHCIGFIVVGVWVFLLLFIYILYIFCILLISPRFNVFFLINQWKKEKERFFVLYFCSSFFHCSLLQSIPFILLGDFIYISYILYIYIFWFSLSNLG